MKGRRRARRAALQALYELDQTAHPLEVVLDARVAELYQAAAAGALPATRWVLVEQVTRRWPLGGFADADIVALADKLQVDRARLLEIGRSVRRWVPNAVYCDGLVRGIHAHRAPIDAVIARIAPEWPVEQMAPVDRNVLRIALWEIATAAVPLRVAINEAVELARTFSGEGSRRMVNGALGAYASGGLRLVVPTAAPVGGEAPDGPDRDGAAGARDRDPDSRPVLVDRP